MHALPDKIMFSQNNTKNYHHSRKHSVFDELYNTQTNGTDEFSERIGDESNYFETENYFLDEGDETHETNGKNLDPNFQENHKNRQSNVTLPIIFSNTNLSELSYTVFHEYNMKFLMDADSTKLNFRTSKCIYAFS